MATEIITLSEFSKKCFIEKFALDPDKIHVVPLSAGDTFFDTDRDWNGVIKKI